MSVEIQCPCGESFRAVESRKNRARYCSRVCKGRYEMHNKPGFHRTGPAWNSGTYGLLPSGDENWNWKGASVGYAALHTWLDRHFGKAAVCEHCQSKRRVEWANRTGHYLRDRTDWLTLCRSCHRRYDIDNDLLGARNALFTATGRRRAA